MKKLLVLFSVLFLALINSGEINGQIITLIAGSGTSGSTGDGGAATAAKLSTPYAAAYDNAGNLYIADFSNNKIREVTAAGVMSTFSTVAAAPSAIIFDGSNYLYVASRSGNYIYKMSLSGTSIVYAGNGTGAYTGDGGAATAASINLPMALALDAGGNLYISDLSNNCIRKVTATGIISTFAGNGTGGFTGDGGQATAAELNGPVGINFDSHGNLYVADRANNRLRMINTSGIISTVSGTSSNGFSGDGGPSTAAVLSSGALEGVIADAYNNIYIADGSRIRKINGSGTISTIAGTGGNTFTAGAYGGAATACPISTNRLLAIDATGNLVVVVGGNSVVASININSITGQPNMCTGNTYTFTPGTAGGSWSSSNTSVATVGSSSGIVSSVAAGMANITYNLSGTNYIQAVTVNAMPGAITGNSSLSTVIGTTLADGTSGGTWSAANTSVATTGTAGIVSGVAAGASVVSYTVNGCAATTTVTVNTAAAGLNFSGSGSYINCGTYTLNSYSKEAWIYLTSFSGYENMISGGVTSTDDAFGAPSGYLSAGHNGSWTAVADPTILSLNTWYHVALTYDAP